MIPWTMAAEQVLVFRSEPPSNKQPPPTKVCSSSMEGTSSFVATRRSGPGVGREAFGHAAQAWSDEMRTSPFRFFTLLTFGLISLAPAEAAYWVGPPTEAAHWECMGPAVACGGSSDAEADWAHTDRSLGRVYSEQAARRLAERSSHLQHSVAYTPAPREVAHATLAHSVAPATPAREPARVATAALQVPAPQPARHIADTASSISVSRPGGAGFRVVRTQSGMASYYGTESGSQTASGAHFNPSAMTAAHRTLPFGTKVRVTNKRNGRSVVVTINDRGPFVRGRVIDLSTGAAGVIGMRGAGVAPVSLEVLGRG
jgi:peptidoglycan lytic transglycosylase